MWVKQSILILLQTVLIYILSVFFNMVGCLELACNCELIEQF